MSGSEATRLVVVQHSQGLHARPAEIVAKAAMLYRAKVEIVRDGYRVDAKSILNLLTLGATQGAELRIEAHGDDASDAVQALADLIESDFSDFD